MDQSSFYSLSIGSLMSFIVCFELILLACKSVPCMFHLLLLHVALQPLSSADELLFINSLRSATYLYMFSDSSFYCFP